MMRNSSDGSSWSDHHRSFNTFFYGASRLDWSDRELNETFSKMTLQCCWCFIDCVYSFNSVFVPPFTVDLSVQLSRGEEILLKFIVFASFHSFFFLKLLFFYIPWLPINSSKRKRLFESQSLSLVLLRIWFILGARVCLFSTENCQGIGGLSHIKVQVVNGLK